MNEIICAKEQNLQNCADCSHVEINHVKRTFDCKCQRPASFQAIKVDDPDVKRFMLRALKTGFMPYFGIDCLYSFFVKSGYQLGADCSQCEAAAAFLTFQETGAFPKVDKPKDEAKEKILSFSIAK
jgi:hypothetical protein